MTKVNKRTPLVFYLGVVLLLATVLTTYFSSGLYARYRTAGSDTDGGRVAAFDVAVTKNYTEELTLSIRPGQSRTYSFTLLNSGETAVHYEIKAENLTKNLPLTFTPVEGNLPAGSAPKTCTFTVSWDANDASADNMGKIDVIRLTVRATQIN
ncbi:MAG: hypothetical protein IJW29_04060 [Clostridia bacterium]|nr:hypothetical protein [Clostridia bacterium]